MIAMPEIIEIQIDGKTRKFKIVQMDYGTRTDMLDYTNVIDGITGETRVLVGTLQRLTIQRGLTPVSGKPLTIEQIRALPPTEGTEIYRKIMDAQAVPLGLSRDSSLPTGANPSENAE